MRIETTTRNLYKFEELSQEDQQKAIEKLYDINVDREWWEFVYDDAERAGLKIHEFDLDRGAYAKLTFIDTAEETAHKIMRDHGPSCETYQTAFEYLSTRSTILVEENLGQDEEDHQNYIDDELEEHDEELLRSLSEDYRRMLQREYDYLTTAEAIRETIEANDYEFDDNCSLA